MLNLEDVRVLLKKAVETQGRDFIYNPDSARNCYYAPYSFGPEDDPRRATGCLIGTMFVVGDIQPPNNFKNWQKAAETLKFSSDIFSVNRVFQFCTTEAVNYLVVAQRAQDSGETWGKAYDVAEEWANNR